MLLEEKEDVAAALSPHKIAKTGNDVGVLFEAWKELRDESLAFFLQIAALDYLALFLFAFIFACGILRFEASARLS